MLSKNIKNQTGFTLMEITAILGIVTVALSGIVSLFNQSIRVQGQNQHYVEASMLAQEGIELLRNKRDNNWLHQNYWLEDVSCSDDDI